MIRIYLASLTVAICLSSTGSLSGQDKSVKPGINDSFRSPDVKQFRERFETESREIYAKRNDILKACRLESGQTVADIGAGTGLFSRMFAEAVGKEGRVIAVDIAGGFLDHIEKTSREAGLTNIETRLSSPESCELPENSIDVAFICDTYHHFEFPLKTMATVHRALKPGGRLILIDFRRVPGKSTDWVLDHVRAGQEVFVSEVVQAGFQKSREVQDVLEENYFVEFVKATSPGLKPLEFPLISGYGGVVRLPDADEQPRAGAKVVFDVTADAHSDKVNKGLERAARLLNLYGVAGLKATDVKIAIVVHGEATRSVLNDEFYQGRFQARQNPNLPLIRELIKAGATVSVCGQALNYKGFPESVVADGVKVADAALTVIVNKQSDGFAYVPVP